MDIPILSEIKKVKDVCSVAKKAQDLNEDIRNYKNYSEIVNEVNTTFTQLFNSYNVLKNIVKIKSDSMEKCFNDYKNSFEDLDINIRNNKVSNTNFIALKGLNSNFENNILQIWEKYVSERLTSTYKTLVVFQDFMDITHFRTLENTYSLIVGNSYPSENTLRKINEFEKTAKDFILSMNADDDVIHFISKVSANQATFADLNEKIVAWIKEHNFTNKIKITM